MKIYLGNKQAGGRKPPTKRELDMIDELVEKTKAHAYLHYEEEGGWDFVIETMEDSDIKELLTGTGDWEHYKTPVTTLEQAIKRVGDLVSLWDEQRFDITW
tara:strand:- start:1050 stop:1352 length:303 start_codon:yes stop_codon:yes gene_type:complete